MGQLIKSFTLGRNFLKRTVRESAEAAHAVIQDVDAGRLNDMQNLKTTDNGRYNVVRDLISFTGIVNRQERACVVTEIGRRYETLYAQNAEDSWRWLVTRTAWLYVVPNGTEVAVNTPAIDQKISFCFFRTILGLLVGLWSLSGEDRFLSYEELCQLLDDDSNWPKSGFELLQIVLERRRLDRSPFLSKRRLLGDLEEQYGVGRDNINTVFKKALAQTGLFEYRRAGGAISGISLSAPLDPVLQRRVRFVLDNPLRFEPGQDWNAFLQLRPVDLPLEISRGGLGEVVPAWPELPPSWKTDASALGEMVEKFCADGERAKLSIKVSSAHRALACLLSKRLLITTGLAGSGKTKLSQAIARWITPSFTSSDPFEPGTIVESEGIRYYVKASDALSVEFWNSESERDAVKVLLPRDLINEWATYIDGNAISEETPARDIREAIQSTSKFSEHLNSFETHLKAAAFAIERSRAAGLPKKCYEIVPVGADWTGNENILGYPNGLDKESYLAKPALNLALQAAAYPEIPHFLILDEMNLSHVERYFADVLSAMESEERIPLHEDGERKAGERRIPPRLELPKNLFIVGTVNVDETTYMFSPKVLDRANVIEFRMDASELNAFLGDPVKPNLAELDGRGAGFGPAFALASRGPADLPEEVKLACEQEMTLFFDALQGHGAEFGYRVAHEAARFMRFYKALGNYPDGDASWFPEAFDCVIVQKLLPKLHGSRAKLGPLLKKLWFLCVNDFPARGAEPLRAAAEAARSTDRKAEPSTALESLTAAHYPLSAEKIGRMWRLLNENGFASFAEA